MLTIISEVLKIKELVAIDEVSLDWVWGEFISPVALLKAEFTYYSRFFLKK